MKCQPKLCPVFYCHDPIIYCRKNFYSFSNFFNIWSS